MSILFKISYGLYLLSAKSEDGVSGCIVNTVMQQTASPEQISVTVNKGNFTHDLIMKSNRCVVNILSTETNFAFIKHFGMQSGRSQDKFSSYLCLEPQGIPTVVNTSLGYMVLEVTNTIDMGTHTMFVCEIAERKELGSGEPLTYSYYQSNVKPKPQSVQVSGEDKEVWVCQICNYEHIGALPDDFICPICKHGKADFLRK